MRKRRTSMVLQTTAMLDVIFILLIFFVAVSKVREGKLDLRLPDIVEKSSSAGSRPEKEILLSVSREDQMELNGQSIRDVADLQEKLSRENPSDRVVIASDREARSGALVAALKVVTESGFQDVSFLYDPRRSPR